MTAERAARLLVLAIVLGLPLSVLTARWIGLNVSPHRTVEIHAKMPESGGWTPGDLAVAVGTPLRLRLTSDDVIHGFAIGQLDSAALEVRPGEVTETTITFSRPGKYVFYCTRWCGVNHWRMRGTIEVSGVANRPETPAPPLYVTLGLNLDAPHPAEVTPRLPPSAKRAADLGVTLPDTYLSEDYYRSHSPAELWRSLRAEPASRGLSEWQVWDLVALAWTLNATPEALQEGKRLYAENCSACHGEGGAGDGVMASALAGNPQNELGDGIKSPADFTEAESMLGASPALLQGKIMRGGMGTGMPYWGPIFTEAQTWALVDYLWSFQFEENAKESAAAAALPQSTARQMTEESWP